MAKYMVSVSARNSHIGEAYCEWFKTCHGHQRPPRGGVIEKAFHAGFTHVATSLEELADAIDPNLEGNVQLAYCPICRCIQGEPHEGDCSLARALYVIGVEYETAE